MTHWTGLDGEIKGTPKRTVIPLAYAINQARYQADNYFVNTRSSDYDFDVLRHMSESPDIVYSDGTIEKCPKDTKIVVLRHAERNDGCQTYFIEAICNAIYNAVGARPEFVSDLIMVTTPNHDSYATFERDEYYLALINPTVSSERAEADMKQLREGRDDPIRPYVFGTHIDAKLKENGYLDFSMRFGDIDINESSVSGVITRIAQELKDDEPPLKRRTR